MLNPVGIKPRERPTGNCKIISAEEQPQVNEIVQNDIYLDDCLSREENVEKTLQRADELELVLNHVDFTLNGITLTGGDLPSALLTDDSCVNLAGMKWFPKEDLLALNIGELNFAKKQHGKKPVQHQDIIPSKLTRPNCVSKVAEIFDLTGKITPITATINEDGLAYTGQERPQVG